MSEQQGNNAENAGIEGEKTENAGENGLREGKDAEVRQAVYEALDARGQYSSKSVKAPENKLARAHYSYTPQSHTSRSYSRNGGRGYGHTRTSSHTAHPTLHTPVHWSDTVTAKGGDGMGWWQRFKQKWGLIW